MDNAPRHNGFLDSGWTRDNAPRRNGFADIISLHPLTTTGSACFGAVHASVA
jgi:hypothetical protein